MWDVAPFDVESLAPSGRPDPSPEVEAPYRRYALTSSGVSPRLLPGFTAHLVGADSHEHEASGHITEDLSVRPRMVEKRRRKASLLFDEIVAPELDGEGRGGLLLVCWGSSRGPVLETVRMLRESGVPSSLLHFSQVWPVNPDHYREALWKADAAVAVESNASGQFARLIRRESGFRFRHRVNRYDGLPLTPRFILEGLDAANLLNAEEVLHGRGR